MAAITPTDPRVVIVGAGPGGLCLGAKLRAAGHDEFVILERADGIGGTWRHNAYPGAACDVPSLLYSFSFFPSAEWTRTYANQPEILAYLERFTDAKGLRPHLRLGVTVRSAAWDEASATWRIGTSDGELVADVLVGAVGMFNEINVPEIPGLDSFGGAAFHSARWDHDVDLRGKAVAVIGSGASAVQIIPAIAPVVDRLHCFQREPQWVLPKKDPPYSDAERAAFRADPALLAAKRAEIYALLEATITYDESILAASQELGVQNLAQVEDPETRRKLEPKSPPGCHRPLISSEYYPTFNLPHVEMVPERIERVTADAVVTDDGRSRPVDVIVLATGFATTKFLSVLDVVGRGGVRLRELWADGPWALLGLAVPGFPNLFMLYGPNTNNGSILHMLEAQADHVVRQVQRLRDHEVVTVEVRRERTVAFQDELDELMAGIRAWHAGCSGYYRSSSGRIVTQWPGSMTHYADAVAALGDDDYETGVRT